MLPALWEAETLPGEETEFQWFALVPEAREEQHSGATQLLTLASRALTITSHLAGMPGWCLLGNRTEWDSSKPTEPLPLTPALGISHLPLLPSLRRLWKEGSVQMQQVKEAAGPLSGLKPDDIISSLLS